MKIDKDKRIEIIGMYQRGYKRFNELGYAIWGILETAIYGKKFNTIDELKAALRRAWNRIDVNVLASAVDNWPKRLRACVEANSGYFEI
uniref:Uncharacterized protein n=1 Tax=Acrobeloides nanus TaxID=290746 RepID=A0A914CLA3_9BILA